VPGRFFLNLLAVQVIDDLGEIAHAASRRKSGNG
jgi:hypothetical protein